MARVACGAAVVGYAAAALGQAPPSYGIDFVTIGSPGNAPCDLPDPGGVSYTLGRGNVAYEYRIGRTEVTTSQWMAFVNTYSVLGGSWTYFAQPTFWGGVPDPSYSGPGQRYILRNVPGAASLPVDGIDWRTAAMYCNWLHNGQSASTSALQNGAYDTSTFITHPNGTFNDQFTRSPGALFWIPSLDEWLKAVHYDPNRYGTGQEGWWMYPHQSDEPLVYGPPGSGQANAGFTLPGWGHWEIPLGAYSAVTTPWGLLDAAGGATEWTEHVIDVGFGPFQRAVEGSSAGWVSSLAELNDRVSRMGSYAPYGPFGGLRVASAVPSPMTLPFILFSLLVPRKRRNSSCK